jgi:chromosomal replication initiation ATPase DnaA
MNRLLEIKNFVESELKVSLTKRNRRKEVVQARYIYAKLACQFTSTTYEAKARAIKRNHASVLHYLKKL